MITFETLEPIINQPTFGDVAENQFFVDIHGNFCQKFDEWKCHIIADKNGTPNSDSNPKIPADRRIKKLLPRVIKINFPTE